MHHSFVYFFKVRLAGVVKNTFGSNVCAFYNIGMELFLRTDVISTRFGLFFWIFVLKAALWQERWRSSSVSWLPWRWRLSTDRERAEHLVSSKNILVHMFFFAKLLGSVHFFMSPFNVQVLFWTHAMEKKNSMWAWIILLAQVFSFMFFRFVWFMLTHLLQREQ